MLCKISQQGEMIGYAVAAFAMLVMFGKAHIDERRRLQQIATFEESRRQRAEQERLAAIAEQRRNEGRA